LKLKDAANRSAAKISNETSQEKSIRLKDAANRSAAKISNETSQEKSIRLKDAANRFEAKISNETLQERSIRLENDAKRYAAKKSSEWLKTHRETQQLARANVENFDRDIYVFAETICEVCSKRCYPSQCAKLNLSNCGFPNYLPQE
jgi:hypothetical protein